MQFIYEANAKQGAAALRDRLLLELKERAAVAWFVSGGSNIPLSVEIMEAIPENLTGKLTILLLDERFGKPGHSDSNWQQLNDAGFKPKKAKTIPVLQTEKTLEATCQDYEIVAHDVVKATKLSGGTIIVQCGIGGDGHIAGILPHSSSVTDSEWVTSYDGGTYKRITTTPVLWEHIDVAYAFAYGDTKQGALKRLKESALSITDQPAQLLKILPEAYVYTDQKI